MKIKTIKTSIFKQDDDLMSFLNKYLKKLSEGDIVVITSKIVALAEGRVMSIEDVKMREKVIKAESQFAMKTKYTWLTIKDNTVMSSAGLDRSNADGMTILLPKDSYQSASSIRKHLMKKHGLKKLGVLITDSRYLPLRAGIVGVSMGYAGFKGVRDYVGKKDLFKRKINYSRVDIADSLAMGVVLEMGEVDEQMPVAVISDAPVDFVNRIDRHELDINVKEDVYQPLFERIKKISF
jgi:dihydrofolate synthase / folylpolyglutamate synthase